MYYIGVDGGGTKTAGVLVDQEGAVLASARTGATNHHAVGAEAARRNLHELIQALLAAAALDAPSIAGIGIGLAGLSTAADAGMAAGWVQQLLPAAPCRVENDAVIALAAATDGDLYGVVAVSGTGMIVLGVNRAGRRARAGGWGPLIGEPGGGFAIGAAALRAVAAAADGLGPATALTPALLGHLRIADERALAAWVYADGAWSRIAALAPLVEQTAQQGDSAANGILDTAAQALAEAVVVVTQRLEMATTEFPCVLTGGNLVQGSLAARLRLRLEPHLPAARFVRPALEPAVGAARLIIRQLHS